MPADDTRLRVGSDSEEEQSSASETTPAVNLKAALAEFMASTMFVIIGCGTACNYGAGTPTTKLIVAFAFGMGILTLAYAISHLSGGQINGAVTWSLVIGGELTLLQGVVNVLAQLSGSVLAALILTQVVSCDNDITKNLGSNVVNPKYGDLHALIGEAIGTFLLTMVVFETAVNPASGSGPNTCLAIGFAVFLAHLLLLPIDGCSINPTRSFGPAVVSHFRGCGNYKAGGMRDLWVMWVGPLIGAAAAAVLKVFFRPPVPKKEEIEEAMAEAMAEAGMEDPRVVE